MFLLITAMTAQKVGSLATPMATSRVLRTELKKHPLIVSRLWPTRLPYIWRFVLYCLCLTAILLCFVFVTQQWVFGCA